MTVLFRTLRISGYVVVFLLSAAVLGLSAYFATIFLPHIHHDFTIFSIVVPSFTIVVFSVLLLWYSDPRIETFLLFISAVAWLAMGAWAADMFGPAECFALKEQKITTSKGSISARSYCYEAKVVEAFSWALFVILTFFMIFVIGLANRSQVLGYSNIWREHINNLPWFGQAPGWPGISLTQYPHGYAGYGYQSQGYPSTYPGAPAATTTSYHAVDGHHIQQQPGHSIIIYPGVNGAPPRVEQVLGTVHRA